MNPYLASAELSCDVDVGIAVQTGLTVVFNNLPLFFMTYYYSQSQY